MMNVVTRCRISSSFPDAPPFPYSLLFFSSVELPMETLTLVRMLVLLSQPDSCSERLGEETRDAMSYLHHVNVAIRTN